MDKTNLTSVRNMCYHEVEAATTNRLLADREGDDQRTSILMRRADQEEKHASGWADGIFASTGRHPDRKQVESESSNRRTPAGRGWRSPDTEGG